MADTADIIQDVGKKHGSVGMNLSRAEHRLLDELVAREKVAAGPYAHAVTKASYLRQLMLADAKKKGLTREMFEQGQPAMPPLPKLPEPGPGEAVPDPDKLRAAVESYLDTGATAVSLCKEAGVPGPRMTDFRHGQSIGGGPERLRALAATLERRGFPLKEGEE